MAESTENLDTGPLEVADVPEPKAKAKPAPSTRKSARKAPKDAVVGGGDTDPVIYSRVTPEGRAKTRKSLTVHHLQRRLTWLGYEVAAADLDGQYGTLTTAAVSAWQRDNEYPEGDLTHTQFLEIFEGDPNVTASVDVPIFE